MSLPTAVLQTDLPLTLLAKGKVRDVYDTKPVLGGELGAAPPLLFVASDRISAFDVLMDNVRMLGAVICSVRWMCVQGRWEARGV